MVICLERGADLHMAQLMPLLLTVSCFSKIQIGFTFLVPAHPDSTGKGPLNVCVCVCVCVRACMRACMRVMSVMSVVVQLLLLCNCCWQVPHLWTLVRSALDRPLKRKSALSTILTCLFTLSLKYAACASTVPQLEFVVVICIRDGQFCKEQYTDVNVIWT